MFFRKNPPVGVGAYHMILGVEFCGTYAQAATFIKEMEQALAGTATVSSADVEIDQPSDYTDGPLRGKPFYRVEISVEDRSRLDMVIDLVEGKTFLKEQPA